MKRFLLGLITVYQKTFGPYFPQSCGFEPTCSHYAREAIETHGALHGSCLACKRMLSCRPRSEIKYDPVPPVVQ